MTAVADFIDSAICHHDDENYLAQEAQEVEKFLEKFPLYEGLN